MPLLGFVSNFYKSYTSLLNTHFYFEGVWFVNTKHLDNTFVLYSLKNEDSLIEPLLYFYKK